jgi:F0F1-type ATP synthase epsilon subunit
MRARALTLQVVTPDGTVVDETGVEAVVLRRKEDRFEPGSEIAIYPRHGPLLLRLSIASARYRKGSRTIHLDLAGGFAEVLRDRVLILTPGAESRGA